MARRVVYAKPKNDVYVGLILLSLLAMFVGCGVLAWEYYGTYDGVRQPPPPPPISR